MKSVVNLKSYTSMTGFYVVFDVDSLSDQPEERGLPHLLEHLICRQLRPMSDLFAQYAIDFNAITTNDRVVFYMVGLDDYVFPLRDEFLSRLIAHPPIDEKELEEELPVVLQEYSNYFAVPFNAILSNGLRSHFGCYGSMGQRYALEHVKKNSLQELYDKLFCIPSLIINVSSSHPYSFPSGIPVPAGAKKRIIPVFRENGEAILETVHPNNILMLGGKRVISNEELHKTQMLNYLLSGDIHKPLLNRLRGELGYCYDADLVDLVLGSSHLVFFTTEVDQRNRDRVLEEFFFILENIYDYITEELFDRARQHFLIKREMQRIGRHNNILDVFYPNLMRDGLLESLTFESVIEHALHYYSEPSSLFIPYSL